jgi:hypothetical protein
MVLRGLAPSLPTALAISPGFVPRHVFRDAPSKQLRPRQIHLAAKIVNASQEFCR